jgi:hypothetical protein
MILKKLRGFIKKCNSCSETIWMQELSDGSWMALDNFDRSLIHKCIFSKSDFK